MDKKESNKMKKDSIEKIKNEKKYKNIKIELIDIIIFLIIFITFGVALLSFFPGIVTSDCVDQINQAKENLYDNGHPIIHSFIIGNLTKLGGIWVPALLQIILFSLIWTYICKILRKYNDSKFNKIFQIIFTIVVSIIPLNFMYSITLWKDILYSYAFLLSLIFIIIGIKENYKFTTIQIILIAVSSASIIKFRKNGIPIGLFIFVILMFLNFIKNKKFKDTLKFIISFCIIIILMDIPQWTVNKLPELPGGNVLNATKVYCMGKLLNEGIEITEEEKNFLNTILDVNEWKNKFDLYNGNEILFNPNINNNTLRNKENEDKFNDIFVKYAKQNKKSVLKHFININSIWWSITERGPMYTVVTSNEWVSEKCDGEYDNKPVLINMHDNLEKYVNATLSNNIIYILLYRPALALYISIILCIIITIKEKKKDYILLLMPMLLNIATYVILISSQDQRYFYPCFMTEYVMILLTAMVFINKKNTKKEKDVENENNKER